MQQQNVQRSIFPYLIMLALLVLPRPAKADEQDRRLAALGMQMIEAGIFGAASTYDPWTTNEPEGIETASGELYDPESWTAAIQTDLRGAFGGIHYGRKYRPAFALIESGDRRVIVKINDVGPLMPGRIVDLNTRTMRYFDPGLTAGLVRDITVTPLPGDGWIAGPIGGEETQTLVLSARQR